jgi:hypothetical protein
MTNPIVLRYQKPAAFGLKSLLIFSFLALQHLALGFDYRQSKIQNRDSLAPTPGIQYNRPSSCEISDLPQLVFSPKIWSFGHSRHWQVFAAPTNA